MSGRRKGVNVATARRLMLAFPGVEEGPRGGWMSDAVQRLDRLFAGHG